MAGVAAINATHEIKNLTLHLRTVRLAKGNWSGFVWRLVLKRGLTLCGREEKGSGTNSAKHPSGHLAIGT
jgi:hypothetical protein